MIINEQYHSIYIDLIIPYQENKNIKIVSITIH